MENSRRVAIVTGGASGIGLEITRHLLSEGLCVVAADQDKDACDAARQFLADNAENLRIVVGDITEPDIVREIVDRAVKDFGGIDILCNNAAFHPMQRLDEHDIDDWRRTFRVNVDASLMLCQAVLPHMKARRAGSIINMGSISGHAPYAGGGAYATSKAAVAMLTRVLAIELGEFGIKVNCIAPGSIRHKAHADTSAPNIPIGRAGKPSEVAALVSYLASPAAEYITGSVIVMDGGATAGRVRKGGRDRSQN